MTAESKTYGLFYMTLVPPWWLLSSGKEECIDYELKSADNPYILMNYSLRLGLFVSKEKNSEMTEMTENSSKVSFFWG